MLENNKDEKIPIFIIALHPKIELTYLGIHTLLYKKLGCEIVKKKGVWCIESNDAERNRIKKFILTLNKNNNNK